MKQYADVIHRARQHFSDVGRRELFELPELEDFPVLIGKSGNALAQRLGHLFGRDESIGRNRRLIPGAVGVEAAFEQVVDRIHQLFTRMCPSAFLHLVMQDAKEPGANFRSPLKLFNRLQKRHEHFLREVVGVAHRESHPPGSPIQPAGMLLNDLLNGLRSEKRHRAILGERT